MATGDLDRAPEVLNQAVRLKPDNAEAHQRLEAIGALRHDPAQLIRAARQDGGFLVGARVGARAFGDPLFQSHPRKAQSGVEGISPMIQILIQALTVRCSTLPIPYTHTA